MSTSRIAENKKLFRSFRKGNSSAFIEILENERHTLFDYMLRMTGQVQKSLDTIEEVFLSLNESIIRELLTFEDLRFLLYTTARKFSSDIWNANTSMLENTAIGEDLKGEGLSEKELKKLKLQQDLDKTLRSLKPHEREAAYLRLAVGMAFSEIADALGVTTDDVEDAYEAALTALEKGAGSDRSKVEDGLFRITKHQIPPRSSHATVNLSMVMEGIKARPSGVWSVGRVSAVIVIVILIGVWAFVPTFLSDIFSSISDWMDRP